MASTRTTCKRVAVHSFNNETSVKTHSSEQEANKRTLKSWSQRGIQKKLSSSRNVNCLSIWNSELITPIPHNRKERSFRHELQIVETTPIVARLIFKQSQYSPTVSFSRFEHFENASRKCDPFDFSVRLSSRSLGHGSRPLKCDAGIAIQVWMDSSRLQLAKTWLNSWGKTHTIIIEPT